MSTPAPRRFPRALVQQIAARRNDLLRARRTLPAIAALAALQGCIAVGGTSKIDSPTLGKQLVDLKGALDCGALSESEYQAAKAELLSRKQ